MDFTETEDFIEGTITIKQDNRPGTAAMRFGSDMFEKLGLPAGSVLKYRFDKKTKEWCFKPFRYMEE